MDGTNMSPADIAALTKNGNGNFTESGMWFVLLLFMLAGGNWNGGNRGPVVMPQSNAATQADLTAGLNNNAIQNQLQSIQLQNAQNDLNMTQAVNNQTTTLLQRDYANNINLLQGYNQINNSINQQTATIGSKLDNLGYQMDQCCCSIKTQMLQDRNADLQNIVNQQANQISNLNQTQSILGQLGRFVAWTPSGTAGASSTTAG